MNAYRPLCLLAFFFFITTAAVEAQDDGMHDMLHASAPDEIYEGALDNWHDGHYPQAMHAFRHLLEGEEADRFFERIALKTGELYRVTELSEDGSAIRFSDDGRYALWQRDGGEGPRTWVHDLSGGTESFAVEGSDVRMLAGGSLLYRRVADNQAVREAAAARDAAIEKARAESDWDLWRGAQADYAAVVRNNTLLLHRETPGSPERDLTPQGYAVGEVVSSPDGSTLFFTGQREGETYPMVYAMELGSGQVRTLTGQDSYESGLRLAGGGRFLVFGYQDDNPFDPSSQAPGQTPGWTGSYDLQTGGLFKTEGELLDASREGERMLLARETEETTTLLTSGLRVGGPGVAEITSTDLPLTDATLSPGGTRVAYALRAQDDYEIYVHQADGSGERMRVSRELQHDRFPAFLDENRLVAAKGEGRHRRSFLYDLTSGQVQKLFHNNTLRTIAPEYEWAVHPDGSKLLIVSERDGDTISPERGVYLLDLSERITREELLARINRNMEREEALRAKGDRLYEQIAEQVAQVTGEVSLRRIYKYEEDLYDFDSKYITQPGNDMAAEYIYKAFESFGYEPEYQWFSPGGRDVYGGKTANVIARLEGTDNPELVYVISSHYDSSERGPGADDNTSGTAALLGAARVLADHPMPATIIFAAFTGEEAGLLGSREFVRRAQESGMRIVGALNNDMVGFANNARLDNTIRYSNPGIRDIQHNAARMFSEMVTYDALYYKFTDAHAYYEAYGDIVGGIGSYPVLGSPFYHQWNDNLETINHQLVAEVSKTTVATLMLLASSPSRLAGLRVETLQSADQHRVSWTASPESNIDHYLVEYEGQTGGLQQATTGDTEITLEDLAPGSEVRVKAVNARGMEGWDWARTGVSRSRE